MPKLLVPRLPAIGCVELVLAEKTAWGLLEILSDDGHSPRLQGLLSEDPPFTLWTICVAYREDRQTLSSVREAAEWTHQSGLSDYLLPKIEPAALHRRASKRRRREWARLYRESLVLARDCRRIVRKHEIEMDPESVRLAALLHNAGQWIASCGSKQSADELDPVLPPGVRSQINTFHEGLGERLGLGSAKRREKRRRKSRKQLRNEHLPVAWSERTPHATEAWYRAARALQCYRELKTDFTCQLEAEKLLAMKELAYGAGHEVNNPLANISSRAQTLLRDESDPERRHKLATINAQAFRAHEMIADMMTYAKPPAVERRAVSMISIVEQVVEELRPMAVEQDTQLEIIRRPPEAEIEAYVDPVQIAVALKAIGTNALESVGSHGKVAVELEYDPLNADMLFVRITDTGPGVSAELRQHVFDPFFSGREAGRGLGFGLCKAWRIVTEHGGEIDLRSCDGVTIFSICLQTGIPMDVQDGEIAANSMDQY